MGAPARADLRFCLLNHWQRGFPIVEKPFATIGAACDVDAETVIDSYRGLVADGAISRIGGVWGVGAGGAALLCAFAVPAGRVEAVAAVVSAHPAVNHNYEREHRHNLWFVVTGRDAEAVDGTVDTLEAQVGCRALRLRMQRAYRVDLGFDLRGAVAARGAAAGVVDVVPVEPADEPLAALVEDGLPLLARPYDVWADELELAGERVRTTLQRWLRDGTLRRFGAIVRHHEAGFAHNAMVVFDVPDVDVDACGELLAAQRGVTLAYRRERDEGWPYNLYCMVHGRDRAAVVAAIDAAVEQTGLRRRAPEVLFSTRRFKQSGARYFGRSRACGRAAA